MVAKRIGWEIVRQALPPRHSPPDLRALSALQFTLQDRATLSAWLAEDGWPRWRMDIAMLEGYLVALLVWPVAIAPGAWLPAIWGVAGWKVPAKINAERSYRKFEDLVVGFLHHLDLRISTPDPGFVPTVCLSSADWHPRSAPGISWAQGFLKALQLALQGLKGRSAEVRSAVDRIAYYASAPTTTPITHGAITAELAAAVNVLAAERTSRGPLGALPMPNRTKKLAPRAVKSVVAAISPETGDVPRHHRSQLRISTAPSLHDPNLGKPLAFAVYQQLQHAPGSTAARRAQTHPSVAPTLDDRIQQANEKETAKDLLVVSSKPRG